MYRNAKVALVIPAHNEERLIGNTLRGVPSLFDRVYVVDDGSRDGQNEVVAACARVDSRIVLIRHEKSQGPGGAIITGYRRTYEDGLDIAVVVGGDNQMDLGEVSGFLDPIIDGEASYTKGNRFLLGKFEDTLRRMPRLRFFANWLLTAMTKIASGYFDVMDVVDGYTAISREAIASIDWTQAWRRYGYPIDFLIRLNAYGFTVRDVPRSAIYLPGERQSQIKGFSYAVRVSFLLVRAFLWRLRFKYVYLDFHPLVFFYAGSFVLIPAGLLLGGWMIWDKFFLDGVGVTVPRAVFVALMLIPGLQFLLFAMLFDRQESRPVRQDARERTERLRPRIVDAPRAAS